MSTRKTPPQEDIAQISAISRQLGNPKKVALIQYVLFAGMATATVIQRKLQYSQSAASKYLRDLTECQMLTREKIGYSIIYSIDKKTWSHFSEQLSDLGK